MGLLQGAVGAVDGRGRVEMEVDDAHGWATGRRKVRASRKPGSRPSLRQDAQDYNYLIPRQYTRCGFASMHMIYTSTHLVDTWELWLCCRRHGPALPMAPLTTAFGFSVL
ncbi:hypothetical protein FH972_021325 [Carpinus fangiana]|uniref:Uncharacterized protein n=1 Tax=Carpinus fangiana TaxID=176857 RepID=A0A5N6KP31_9ROSI|nr:hypothetical protein FH972_021325 [Carpinus fangiana]